jgi:hypothetical protein
MRGGGFACSEIVAGLFFIIDRAFVELTSVPSETLQVRPVGIPVPASEQTACSRSRPEFMQLTQPPHSAPVPARREVAAFGHLPPRALS